METEFVTLEKLFFRQRREKEDSQFHLEPHSRKIRVSTSFTLREKHQAGLGRVVRKQTRIVD